MKTVSFTLSADPGDWFMPHALDGIIGNEIRARVNYQSAGKVKIITVEVSIDGRSANITAEAQGLLEELAIQGIDGSIRLNGSGTIDFTPYPAEGPSK